MSAPPLALPANDDAQREARTSHAAAAPVVNRIGAETMLAAVESDPQLRPPQRPVFCPDVLVVDLPDGVLVEGAPERAVFRGAAAVSMLPALIPLMDGTRDAAQLSTTLGTGAGVRAVKAAIALLYTAGLVYDGPLDAPEIPSAIPASVVAAVRRTLDSTRVHRSPGAAFASIADSRVVLLSTGDGEFAHQVGALLAAAGDSILVAEPGDPIRLVADDLVVLVDDLTVGAESADRAGWWAGRCAEAGAAALRVVVSADWVEIGPRFDARYSICPDCFRADAASAAGEGASGEVAVRPRSAARTAVAAGMVAMEVYAQRLRVGTAKALTGYTRIHVNSLVTEPKLVTRRPGCLSGHLDPRPVTDPLPAGYVYDQSVGFPPKALLDPKGHQVHYKVGNIVIQHEHRSYGSATRGALPRMDLDVSRPSPDVRRSAPTVDSLAQLLLATFGLKPARQTPRVLRYAPTGGNLGSPQGFVVVESVDGLPPAIYYYESFDHQLSKIAELTPEMKGRLRAAGIGPAPAHVVFTAAYARVAHKYGMLAWRICCLDAGVSAAQAIAVGGPEFGVARTEGFDSDLLAGLLGLDPTVDPVTAVLRCGDEHPSRSTAQLADLVAAAGDGADSAQLAGLTDRPSLVAAMLGHRGGRGRSTPLPTGNRDSVLGVPAGRQVSLPPASVPDADLRAVLARRRAERFYGDPPVAAADLRAICEAALGPADRIATAGHQVAVTVVARSVESVAAGVYTYRRGGALQLQTSLTGDPGELVGSVLQVEFASAPVILVVTGPIGPVSQAEGVDGYRRLLVDGGEAAHRAWLAALRRGLVGSTFAGLLGPDLYRLADVDGYFRGGLLGLAIGRPTD